MRLDADDDAGLTRILGQRSQTVQDHMLVRFEVPRASRDTRIEGRDLLALQRELDAQIDRAAEAVDVCRVAIRIRFDQRLVADDRRQ